jgi:hypothetical protein
MVKYIGDSRELRENFRVNQRNGHLAMLLLELFERNDLSLTNYDACEALGWNMKKEWPKAKEALRKYIDLCAKPWSFPRYPKHEGDGLCRRYVLTKETPEIIGEAYKEVRKSQIHGRKAVKVLDRLRGVELTAGDAAQVSSFGRLIVANGTLDECVEILKKNGLEVAELDEALLSPDQYIETKAASEDDSRFSRAQRLEERAQAFVRGLIGSGAAAIPAKTSR